MTLRVALLCSHRAPGLRFLLHEDPLRGRLYNLVCCLSSEEKSESREEAESAGLPFLSNPIARFSAVRGTKRTDLSARSDYDRETLALVAPYEPDVLVSCALDDHRAQRLVAGEREARLSKVAGGLDVEGVEALAPVDGNDPDRSRRFRANMGHWRWTTCSGSRTARQAMASLRSGPQAERIIHS